MDHFALPEDELARAQREGGLHRNFMGYTTHAESDLVGAGVSAISHIGASFSQNPRDIGSWEQAIDAGRLPVWRGMHLDEDDVIRADVIQALMCHGTLDFDALGRRHVIDFRDYFRGALERIAPLQDDGPGRARRPRPARHLARTAAAAYHRHVLRPISHARRGRGHAPVLAHRLSMAGAVA